MSAAASTLGASTAAGVFANRNFRLYLSSVLLNNLAIQIQSVAVAWQVYALSGSPLALGYVGLAQFVPILALCLPAGNLADRCDRRLILALSFALQGLAAGGFLVFSLATPRHLWPLYLLLALFGSARAFGGPAAQSLLPQLVERAQFPQAVAWNSSSNRIGVIVGPALGGAIYLLGPAIAYGVCLALFAAIAGAIVKVRTAARPEGAAEGGMLQRLTAGIRYVRGQPIVLGAISLDLFAVLLGGATALLPVYARDILHVGPSGLGLLRSAPAVGAAIVGLWLGRRPLNQRAGAIMFAGVACFGLATIIFGLSTNFGLSLCALAALGACDMLSVYVRATLIQLATPDPMRGRVSAVNRVFVGASNELGGFESGVTAALFGTVPAVVLGGVGTLAVVAGWWRLFPALRQVDRLTDVIA
jgi:MFS family permease